MNGKKDIESREDIILLVNTFYKKLEQDPTIGFIFTKVMQVNWEKHLPKMYDFWESVLFGKALFKGNPMVVHFEINKEQSLREKEFNRWKELFFETVDELFEGDKSQEVKQKATSIADLMHYKINSPSNPGININLKNNN